MRTFLTGQFFSTILQLSCLAVVWLMAAGGQAVAAEKTPPPNPPPIDQQCETEIAVHHQKLFADYAKALSGLARSFQEKADLDNLLLVKAEQDRFTKEKTLLEINVASGPPDLRQLQAQCLSLLKSTKEHVACRYYQGADSLKKKHTREGDIPKALAFKADMDRLVAKYPFLVATPDPAKKPDQPAKVEPPEPDVKPVAANAVVKVEDLYADYVKDANVANQKYKERKFTIQGEITGFYSGSGSRDFGVALKVPGTAWRIDCLCSYRGEGSIVVNNDSIAADAVVGKKAPVIIGTTQYSGKTEHKFTFLLWIGETRDFTGQCQGVIGGRILFEDCTWADAKK
ncbi:MAG: hypothetical protein HY360_05985 [Verrucomicrobia bacterium]|nr:hypothetical protein [Verrucomicrobiota bacterium]